MSWTTFASLTNPTLPELDANFNILSALVPIPCTMTGTNTVVLTSAEGAGAVTAYQQNMTFIGIAANTNSGAVTAQPVLGNTTLTALAVYKDTLSGPVALSGSEIIQNCAASFRYDSALNSNAGGFHLGNGGGQLSGQTVSLAALTVTSGGTFGTLVATLGTIGIGSLASLIVAGGDALLRLNSGQFTLGTVTLGPGSLSFSTIALSGAAAADNILVTPISSTAFGTIGLRGYVSATGSVVIGAQNVLQGATVTVAGLTYRATNLGFAV